MIEMNEITKVFPGVVANDSISFQVRAGEIHALLGENGAGKSTLMSVLAGLYQPDAGSIKIKGNPVQFRSPRSALAVGVGMIYQHFRLVDNFTVAENIVLGAPGEDVVLNSGKIEEETARLSEKFGLDINPRARISQLSLGEQQRVEILKMLYRGCDILIMDEPTTVLTPQEVKELFKMIRKMADQGKSIVLITHKLNEVLEVADSVTVLRRGRVVGNARTADLDEKALTHMMVGRELMQSRRELMPPTGELLLKLDNLKVLGDQGNVAVTALNLEMHSGEIVGIAGVAGNGQRELVEAIAGLRKIAGGSILLDGQDISLLGVRERLDRGINIVPEDRLGMGLVPNLSVIENAILHNYNKKEYSSGFFLNYKKIRAYTHKLVQDYDVALADIEHPVNYLSGGNLQKLLLGREISQQPRLLIASYPVRGLDVAATESVFNLLLTERAKGTSILLILEDLDDIFRLADRIAVMYAGTIKAVFDNQDADVETVGMLMLGGGGVVQ
ncbi:MAG: ABC transporter ATP-binding protein [Syntrophomonadaceae bacterium]|nr:ABC transporter ATP-binding protein [Syntrophomonadaceae bacterium]